MEDAVAQRILECFEAAYDEGFRDTLELAQEIRRRYSHCPLSNTQLEGAVMLVEEVFRPGGSQSSEAARELLGQRPTTYQTLLLALRGRREVLRLR